MKAVSPFIPLSIAVSRRSTRLSAFTLVTLATLFVLLTSTVQSASLQPGPQAPDGDMVWGTREFVDSLPYFRNMTDRSLRLDSTGAPRVAFGGKYLYYAWYDTTALNWKLMTVDPTLGVGEYASLALDNDNRPRISYFDTYNNALKFAYCNGDTDFCETPTNWSIRVVDKPVEENLSEPAGPIDVNAPDAPDATPGVGMNSSIVVDKYNQVHISYYDSVNRILKYASWNGLEWKIEVVDKRYDTGTWSSIAVDDNAQPYISYMSEQYDDLKFAEIKSNSWRTTNIDTNGNVGAFTSLALDSDGVPHVSYRDKTNGNLKYATRKADGSWSKTVVDNLDDVGGYTSIAIKPNDTPCISYYDYTHRTLKYTCGDGWKVYTLTTIIEKPGDVKPEGMFTSLAFDKSGVTHISYLSSEGYLKHAMEDPKNVWSRTVINKYPGWYAGDVGLYTSLVFDNADIPHISYFSNYDNEWPNNLKYANKAGGSWNTYNLSDLENKEGIYTSIDLDSNGEPRIAYYDIKNADLKQAKSVGGIWNYQLVDSANDRGQYASLAVDQSNGVHISYYDATTKFLMYAHWDGDSWAKQVLDDGLDSRRDVGQYTSLAVFESASGPLPAVSYYDATEGNLRIAYKTPNLGAWEFETLDTDTKGDVGLFTSLALQPDINSPIGYYPHIVYYDDTNNDLKYAVKTPNGWTYKTVDSEGDVGQYASIALDALGRPHISYYDATNQDLKYATENGITWYRKAIDTRGDVGMFTSLALKQDGRPCISYYDYTNGALKYVCATTIFWSQYLSIVVR